MLPARIKHKSDKADAGKRSPAHRNWVRGHACCACGSQAAIECAHVRMGTDGGMGTTLTIEQFSGLIELILMFGAKRDVRWSEPMERAA